MSPAVYLTTLSLFFGTLIVGIALHYITSAYRARMQGRGGAAYRAIAEAAAQSQAESGVALVAIRAELKLVSERLASVEAMLKAVG